MHHMEQNQKSEPYRGFNPGPADCEASALQLRFADELLQVFSMICAQLIN